MIKESIQNILNENPDITTVQIAEQLDTTEYKVLQNMPLDKAKVIDGKNFEAIIEDIASWGKILMIKITPSFVIEIKDNMPIGTIGHGYYNFNSENSSIHGHLKFEDIENIIFVSKMMRGRLSHSVVFYDTQGEHIFKVFVTRDSEGELLSTQVDKFMTLKNKFD